MGDWLHTRAPIRWYTQAYGASCKWSADGSWKEMTLLRLPNDYYQRLKALEDDYLSHDDPLRQSGFGGGSINWRNKRGIVLEAITGDGTFLDVGCANGYLLECLASWADEGGMWADQFFVGDIWDWSPPRQFHYVSTRYVFRTDTSQCCLIDSSRRSWHREGDLSCDVTTKRRRMDCAASISTTQPF
jgi:hypothetical protein